METRTIMIIDSASNRQVEINTDATTFGELKTAVIAAGISTEGKDWLEGITKTQPASDDSILPTNVNYKGTTTNNLVYMLTNTNKQIKSGVEVTRKDMIALFKNDKEMSCAFKEKYGKNYINSSNVELIEFINTWNTPSPSTENCSNCNYKDAYEELCAGVASLLLHISEETSTHIWEIFSDSLRYINEKEIKDIKFSKEDIDKMFN